MNVWLGHLKQSKSSIGWCPPEKKIQKHPPPKKKIMLKLLKLPAFELKVKF
jgi:hypothetical protein